MLFNYMKDTQRLLREQRQEFNNPDDLIAYINRGRREVAMRTQCVRVLTPSSGSIIGYSITNNGSGYSANPTAVVTSPDFPSGIPPYPNGLQAIAVPIVQSGGVIADLTNTLGGYGYFQPQVSVTDPTGTGFAATPIVGGLNLLQVGQEVYPYASMDLSMNPGVSAIYFVRSVSIIYANYRYSLPGYSFTTYQSMIRQYPFQYQYVPTFFSQYGQGTNGSLYMYPLPSQIYQFELDCQCIPSDLIDDQSVEVIPQPWQDAVAYFAAYFAMMELGNLNGAGFYLTQYEKFALAYSNYARPGRVVNTYGRY